MKFEKFPFKIEKQYRLPNWDYSNPGFYFITICTKDRVKYFGDISQNKIILSKTGLFVYQYIKEINFRFQNILIPLFSIMPNHIHLLVSVLNLGRNAPRRVPTTQPIIANKPLTLKSFPTIKTNICGKIQPLISQSLPSVVNHLKGYVTKKCKENAIKFSWQPRYYDHIIHSQKEYFAIRRYIKDNPKNWLKDKEFIYE